MKYQGFDGSGLVPRPEQVEALGIIAKTKGNLAFVGPTGIGKSGICRAVQIVDGADIITPSNALLDQYGRTYPTANIIKGVEHYESEEAFDMAIARFNNGEPSMFNPLSYYYRVGGGDKLVVDEAHKLYSMMRLVNSDRFSKEKYNPPVFKEKCSLWPWLEKLSTRYKHKASLHKSKGEFKQSLQCRARARKLQDMSDGIFNDPDDFIYWYEDGTLIIEPLTVSRKILNKVLGKETILLSATLPKVWVERLLGTTKFHYQEFHSPIPAEQRLVHVEKRGFTSQTSPSLIAAWIKHQRSKHGDPNTLVHCTYELGAALHKLLPGSHYHEKTTKKATEKLFRKNGGVWLAAGSSEGLDLPGDTARLNLIPVLPFQNLGSPLVQGIIKRYPGEYELETLITFIQQCGRTTRGIDDSSTTVTGDYRLKNLIEKCRDSVPSWFAEAIRWN